MKKFNDILCKVLSEIVILLVAGSVFVTALNVFMRFVLNSPFFWVEQVASYMFLYIIMLGLPIAYRNGSMIAFDLLVTRFPIKVQQILAFIFHLITTGFFGFYMVQAIRLTMRAGAKMTPGIVKFPMGYLYIGQAICAFLMLLITFEIIIKASKELFGKKEGGLTK